MSSFLENSVSLKRALHSSYPLAFLIISAMRFLIGNKMDLEKLVSDESVEDFASAHECDSAFFVSAKTGNIWTNTCNFETSITLAQTPPFNVQGPELQYPLKVKDNLS